MISSMNLVYYAHSYRKADIAVVEFFGELIRSENLIASLDPPSDRLNSAKPERHLRSTDGMLAVLTERDGGVSQYILYEISLCLRAKKPLLVFLEDTLPNGLIPSRVLQRRFSRKALLRQIRDHRHALRAFHSYIGDKPPGAYQPSVDRRKCLLSGSNELLPSLAEQLQTHLAERGYSSEILCGDIWSSFYSHIFQDTLGSADLAVAFVDSYKDSAEFYLGSLRASFVPTILLTYDSQFLFNERIPREYQARVVDISTFEALWPTITDEIAITEEEYVDLENQDQVTRYAELLFQVSRSGQYTEGLRNLIVEELHMGDKNINYGQAGSMGRESTGTLVNYGAAWEQLKATTDMNSLTNELTLLRAALRKRAQTIEEDKAVVAVADAEVEAQAGNGPGVLQKLATVGKWGLSIAKEIGVKVAAETIQKSLGM
jgi:hypothetical protein